MVRTQPACSPRIAATDDCLAVSNLTPTLAVVFSVACGRRPAHAHHRQSPRRPRRWVSYGGS